MDIFSLGQQPEEPVKNTLNEFEKGSIFKGRGKLSDMVTELDRQVEAANDFVADTRDMLFDVTDNGGLTVKAADSNLRDFFPREGAPVRDTALVQVGQKAPVGTNGIPGKFFRAALQSNPRRTLDFLNGVMHDDPKRRLVRCLDGSVRAFLSDHYRIIDSRAILKHCLTVLRQAGGEVLEASLSDTHMRVKMISREIFDKIERGRDGGGDWYSGGLGNQEYLSRVAARTHEQMPGDTVWPTGTVKNSETGHGSFEFNGGILHACCFNLARVMEVLRAVHLGKKLDTEIYSRETVEAEAEAIFCKARDNINAFFTQESFAKLVAKCQGTAEQILEKPTNAIKNLVMKSDTLADDDMGELLSYFAQQPGEQSVYNVGQAVARYAQDFSDPQRAEEMESLAGEILVGKHSFATVS